MRRFRISLERRHMLEGYVFVLPFVLGVILFLAFPIYISIKLSFGKLTKMSGFQIEWSGFQNYANAFLLDINFVPYFLQVVNLTMYKAPMIIIFSLLLAILVNKSLKFRGFFRVAFFIPFLLGAGEVMAQLITLGVDRQIISLSGGGLVPRELLTYFGPTVVSAMDAMFGFIVMVLWSSGVQILLFLSGLQNIPVSLYESAKMDGATEWEAFWKITMPMISPIMLLVIIYTLVDSFINLNNALLHYIRSLAFANLNFTYAAALGWIYFAFIILLVLVVWGVFSRYMSMLDSDKKGVIT